MGTITKDIKGHNGGNGWYLIASPLAEKTEATNVGNLINDNLQEFDLYRFNQAADKEWENWKKEESDHYHFNLEPGLGYLYANVDDVTLTFIGDLYSGSGEVTLTKNDDYPLSGWNLVGNPFATEAYIERDFYVMNGDRDEIVPAERNYIEAMEGVFVRANEDGETLTFITESGKGQSSKPKPEQIVLNLTRDRGFVIDRAIVRMGEGRTLPKFQINRNSTKIYLPQGDTDYAIACAKGQNEMPLNFEPSENGTYTLTVSAPLTTNLSTLTLIDNLTGTNVDLLVEPSYTFEGRTTDYASRFRLVFSAIENDNEDSFAFIDAAGNLIITGEGTLQIFDVLGHQFYAKQVSLTTNLSTLTSPGVYVLRLINGDSVKTQKIVMK